jgi:hypothetical protein
MSVIYMIHPIHGAKVAISSHEADYDEMHGWERFDPTAAPAPAVNHMHPLDHDGDGRLGGSLPGENSTRRRGRRRAETED